MEQDENMGDAVGTMVTALAWVSRGYAKPVLEGYEPSAKELSKHQKLQQKISKGNKEKDLGKLAKQVEENLEQMEIDGESEDDGLDAPIFTPELAALKAKETGQEYIDDDENMDGEEDGA